MTKTEIVDVLARERRVESIVQNIAHESLTPELKDLAQMVYLVILEYDETKIVDLWDHSQINYFITRVILNQFRSSNSPYHKDFRKYQSRSTDITDFDTTDEQ